MIRPDMKAMLMAGMHYGHSARFRCPKMSPYIYAKRNGIHIINLEITAKYFLEATAFLYKQTLEGKTVLFVGTKRQAAPLIKQYAEKVGMPYVNHRWLGGMLTNFNTVRKSVQKLIDYEEILASDSVVGMSKKERLRIERKTALLNHNLGGIRDLGKLPDLLFVIDVKKEEIAVAEANKLKTPVIGVVDTNSSPDLVDYVIPGNDDASKSIELYLQTITQSIEMAQKKRASDQKAKSAMEEASLKPVPKSMAKVKLKLTDDAPSTEPSVKNQKSEPDAKQKDQAASSDSTTLDEKAKTSVRSSKKDERDTVTAKSGKTKVTVKKSQAKTTTASSKVTSPEKSTVKKSDAPDNADAVAEDSDASDSAATKTDSAPAKTDEAS